MRRRRIAHLSAASMLLAAASIGCSRSENPSLYTIAPITGSEQRGGPKIIVVRQVTVAGYLDRTPIVRSSEGYRLDVLANDWWGEPLSALLTRVLVEELGQRLPQSTVLSDASAVSAKPDVTVEVGFQRLDRDSAGAMLLQAQAGLNFPRRTEPAVQAFRISVPATSPDTRALVADASTAVGQLADGLAVMLTQNRTGR